MLSDQEGTQKIQTHLQPTIQRDAGEKQGGKNVRKRARSPDGNESVDTPELPPIVDFATIPKVRHGKQKMKPSSSDGNIVQEQAAEAETLPPAKKSKRIPTDVTEKNIQRRSMKSKSSSESKSESGKGKEKLQTGKKRQLEQDEYKDSAEPPVKKMKMLDSIKGKKFRGEFMKAIKSISSNAKEALRNPGILAKEVKMYTRDFITDTKKIKTEFTDGAMKFADIMLQPTSHKKLCMSEEMILKGNYELVFLEEMIQR